MTTERRRVLAAASRAGEPISIAYDGGSQPGTLRHVIPLAVTARELVAEELVTGDEKTFLVAKVRIPEEGYLGLPYDFERDPGQTISDRFRSVVKDLEAAGWHVELAEDEISLHRFFKNGKPRKAAAASLGYWRHGDSYIDRDGNEERLLSSRPYAVRSDGLSTTRTYTHLSSAAAAFMQQARELAPGRAEED